MNRFKPTNVITRSVCSRSTVISSKFSGRDTSEHEAVCYGGVVQYLKKDKNIFISESCGRIMGLLKAARVLIMLALEVV